MTFEEILEYDKEIVSLEVLERIEESEFVKNCESIGMSGMYCNCEWFLITLTDNKEIDIYLEK